MERKEEKRKSSFPYFKLLLNSTTFDYASAVFLERYKNRRFPFSKREENIEQKEDIKPQIKKVNQEESAPNKILLKENDNKSDLSEFNKTNVNSNINCINIINDAPESSNKINYRDDKANNNYKDVIGGKQFFYLINYLFLYKI